MQYAAGYLRRSSVSADSPGDASREAQEAAVRRLGATELYTDWGVSGRRDDRTAYVRLKADIEAGMVSAVYAYSLSRLGRNARELDALFTLCESRGVTVQTEVEGALSGKGAFGGFIRRVLSALAHLEAELAAERSAAARAIRQERGDRLGHPPHGFKAVRDENGVRVFVTDPDRSVAPVLDAYTEVGTVQGAARLLNARGVPSPRGKRWGTSETRRVLVAHGAALPAHGKPGRRPLRVPVLAKLLRCHCGGTLTPNVARGQYYCPRAKGNGGHGRYNVTEASLMAWVHDEAARLSIPFDVALSAEDAAAEVDAVDAKRQRVVESYLEGLISKPDRDARLAELDVQLDRIEARQQSQSIPPSVDWGWTPDRVNATLRALWDHVQLDEQLRPVSAEWHVPEWRAGD